MKLFKHRLTTPWNAGYDASRWVLSLSLDMKRRYHRGLYLSYEQELLSKETKEWRINGGYLSVSVSTHFSLGPQHIYYDGPHCSFSLGFLHFSWNLWWCLKCMPAETWSKTPIPTMNNQTPEELIEKGSASWLYKVLKVFAQRQEIPYLNSQTGQPPGV